MAREIYKEYTGNWMIDGDDGRHPFSPIYKEKESDFVQADWCVMCGDYYHKSEEGTIDACGKCMHDEDYLEKKLKEKKQ